MPDPKLPNVTREQVRAEFVDMLMRDWLGPAGGEDEVIYEASVRDRYLVGALAPIRKASEDEEEPAESSGDEAPEPEVIDPVDEQGELAAGTADDGEDGSAAPPIPRCRRHGRVHPLILGLTVSLSSEATSLIAEVRYGRYVRERGRRTQPCVLAAHPRACGLPSHPGARRSDQSYLCRTEAHSVSDRGLPGGERRLLADAVPGQWPAETKRKKDECWIFQPEIALYSEDGAAILAKRPLSRTLLDAEDRAMEMLYRTHQEFAVGHGVGVAVESDPANPARAFRVETRVLPHAEITPMGARPIPSLQTDMAELAVTPQGGFRAALQPLVDAYKAWLDAQAYRVQHPDLLLRPYVDTGIASTQIDHGRQTMNRTGRDRPAGCRSAGGAGFQFANQAVALQRVRTPFSGGPTRHAAGHEHPRCPAQPQLASLPVGVHPAQPAGNGRSDTSRSQRSQRADRHRRSALVPHRRRQDGSLSRPDCLHAGYPPPASRTRRFRRGGCGRKP
ncbi:MAG: hypothetical protein IPK19_41405 [Chloroflexi bacterium]|nr:hypothetical protein [Chloroflexota bacterium]